VALRSFSKHVSADRALATRTRELGADQHIELARRLMGEGLVSEPELLSRLYAAATMTALEDDLFAKERIFDFVLERLEAQRFEETSLPANPVQLIEWLAQRGDHSRAWKIAHMGGPRTPQGEWRALVVHRVALDRNPQNTAQKIDVLDHATLELSSDSTHLPELRQHLILGWASVGKCSIAAKLATLLSEVEIRAHASLSLAAGSCIVDDLESARVIADAITDPLPRAQVSIRLLWRDSLDISR